MALLFRLPPPAPIPVPVRRVERNSVGMPTYGISCINCNHAMIYPPGTDKLSIDMRRLPVKFIHADKSTPNVYSALLYVLNLTPKDIPYPLDISVDGRALCASCSKLLKTYFQSMSKFTKKCAKGSYLSQWVRSPPDSMGDIPEQAPNVSSAVSDLSQKITSGPGVVGNPAPTISDPQRKERSTNIAKNGPCVTQSINHVSQPTTGNQTISLPLTFDQLPIGYKDLILKSFTQSSQSVNAQPPLPEQKMVPRRKTREPVRVKLLMFEKNSRSRNVMYSYVKTKVRNEMVLLSKKTKILRRPDAECKYDSDFLPSVADIETEMREMCPLLTSIMTGLLKPKRQNQSDDDDYIDEKVSFSTELRTILAIILNAQSKANLTFFKYIGLTVHRLRSNYSDILDTLNQLGLSCSTKNVTRLRNEGFGGLKSGSDGRIEPKEEPIDEGYNCSMEQNVQPGSDILYGAELIDILQEYEEEIKDRLLDKNDDIHKIAISIDYDSKPWFTYGKRRRVRISKDNVPSTSHDITAEASTIPEENS